MTREDLEDPNKTNPNIRVGPFPKPSERPPVSPPKTWTEADLEKINRTIAALGKPYEYGGIKLHDVKFLPNGDLAGTDENGVRFIVPSDEVHMFHGDEQE